MLVILRILSSIRRLRAVKIRPRHKIEIKLFVSLGMMT